MAWDHQDIESPKLDAALSKQLTAEFGVHGKRAVASLETAQRLLNLETGLLPRHGETVAYCLRVALDEIPRASGMEDPGRLRSLSRAAVNAANQYRASLQLPAEEVQIARQATFSCIDDLQDFFHHHQGIHQPSRWRSLSKAVVDAANQYRASLQLPTEEVQIARQATFSCIDDLQDFFHHHQGIHQERLKELFRQRTGTEPLSSGTTPLREYQSLLNDCNRAAHDDCTLDEARTLWSRCLELLQRFFLAHDHDPAPRKHLARIDSPNDDDLKELLGQLTTPVEVRSFLNQVETPGWLRQLARSGALGALGSQLWWAACTAAIRISDTHREEIVQWLHEIYSQHSDEAEPVRCIAYAARRIAGNALDLLLKIVHKHPTDGRVAVEGMNAALNLDAAHPMVIELGDALLNASNWERLHLADKFVDHVANGTDEGNSLERIRRMSFKLLHLEEELDLVIGSPSGTMDDAHKVFPHDGASVLLGCVTRMLRTAWDWHAASALLECINSAPNVALNRLRAWILANATDVNPDMLVAEISEAISARDATGDDVALIERSLELGNREVCRTSWLKSLGDAPDVNEVQRAVDSGESLPEYWWRAHSWIPILPETVTETWAAPCQVLNDEAGKVTREQLLTRNLPQIRGIGSPMDVQHFAGMSPMDAAATIAQWRPDSADFYVNAYGLARVLQELVVENPESWLSDPLDTVTRLHHPTYISAYLRAIKDFEDQSVAESSGLLDVAKLVTSEPWLATPIGRNQHHYEPDWIEARRAAVELIGTIAVVEESFGVRADGAWELIESEARHQPCPDGAPSGDSQTARAEIRLSTSALEQAVRFVDAELNASKPLRTQFEGLLEYSLRLDGDLGLEHRIVLAANILWLQHWMPEWTASAMELIIGSDAPDELGEATFEWMLRRNPPSRWLCEDYPEMLHGAARQKQEPALGHLLVAMLHGWKGHSIETVAKLLEQHTELVPEVAVELANLLRNDEVNKLHLDAGVALWQMLLQSSAASHLAGFGWMSIVTALDDVLWAWLTRQTIEATLGKFGWDEEVAERAMTEPFTTDKLAILDLLVRHTPSDWVRRCIADNANTLLNVRPDLAQTPEHIRLRTALIGHGLVPKE